jgi:hypothetical protein
MCVGALDVRARNRIISIGVRASTPLSLTDSPLLPPAVHVVVTIHMLRGDASGRSFYIKPREDVAALSAANMAREAGVRGMKGSLGLGLCCTAYAG